jgi:hypothetical protein
LPYRTFDLTSYAIHTHFLGIRFRGLHPCWLIEPVSLSQEARFRDHLTTTSQVATRAEGAQEPRATGTERAEEAEEEEQEKETAQQSQDRDEDLTALLRPGHLVYAQRGRRWCQWNLRRRWWFFRHRTLRSSAREEATQARETPSQQGSKPQAVCEDSSSSQQAQGQDLLRTFAPLSRKSA